MAISRGYNKNVGGPAHVRGLLQKGTHGLQKGTCTHCAARTALLTHFKERLRDAIKTEEFLLARVAALEALLPHPALGTAFPPSPSKGAADPIVDLQSCEASAIKAEQDSPIALNSDKVAKSRAHADHNAPAEEAKRLWSDRDPVTSHVPVTLAGGKIVTSETLFTPDPSAASTHPGANRAVTSAQAGAGAPTPRLFVDTSLSHNLSEAGTSDTLMLLEQVKLYRVYLNRLRA